MGQSVIINDMSNNMKNQDPNCKRFGGVKNFSEWLERIKPEKRELVMELYDLVRGAFSDFEESIKWGNPCFSFEGAKRCYIAEQASYLHMGFYNGAFLSNPDGVIEGTGKHLRHIKVRELTPNMAARIADAVRQSASLPTSASSR